jgi:MFS family permease
MTIGQISEVLFMLLLPVFFTRFGFKKTILVGMLPGPFATSYSPSETPGLEFTYCLSVSPYTVFVTTFSLCQAKFTPTPRQETRVKSAAQGLITLATYGVGMLIGFAIAGQITDSYALAMAVTSGSKFGHSPPYSPLGFLLFLRYFSRKKK